MKHISQVSIGSGNCDTRCSHNYFVKGLIFVSAGKDDDLNYAVCFTCYDKIHAKVMKARQKAAPKNTAPNKRLCGVRCTNGQPTLP